MSDPRYAHKYIESRAGLCQRIVGTGLCGLPESDVVHTRWKSKVNETIENSIDYIRELEAELARYKAIIDRYAKHDSLCQMMDGRITIEYRTCTCGFDEALKEI